MLYPCTIGHTQFSILKVRLSADLTVNVLITWLRVVLVAGVGEMYKFALLRITSKDLWFSTVTIVNNNVVDTWKWLLE